MRLEAIFGSIALVLFCFTIYSGTFNPGDTEGTLDTGSMDTSDSHCVDVSTLDKISLQFEHTITDYPDFALALKASTRADASAAADYDSYPSSFQTITTSAAGSYWWAVDTKALGQICVVYTKGSNSIGTYTVYYRKEVPTK